MNKMLMIEVKVSLVIITCTRTADLLARQPMKIPVFLLPYVSHKELYLEMKARCQGKSAMLYWLVIPGWLLLSPQDVFCSYPQLGFDWLSAKAVNRNPEADCERSFCKAFDGILWKDVPLLVLGKEMWLQLKVPQVV